MDRMNINHLAIFHAVAEEGNISRGAVRLFISQPAVSKQLAELERSLGTRLFDRLPKGVRLTEAGQLLHSHSVRLFAVEAEAERALAELHGLQRGRLAIGASTTIGNYLLPEILARFHGHYPGIEIALEIGNTEVIQHRLREGKLDLGLTEGLVDSKELEAEVFLEDELVAIAAPDHPLLKRKNISLRRLCREPFVLREPGSGTRAVVERALAGQGFTVLKALSLGSTEAIKRAVATGVGVAIVSRLSIAVEVETGRLVVIPVSDLSLRRPLHRLQISDRHQGQAVQAFLALLATQTKPTNDSAEPSDRCGPHTGRPAL